MKRIIKSAIEKGLIEFSHSPENNEVSCGIGETEVWIYLPDFYEGSNENYINNHTDEIASLIFDKFCQYEFMDPIRYGYIRDYLFSHALHEMSDRQIIDAVKEIY